MRVDVEGLDVALATKCLPKSRKEPGKFWIDECGGLPKSDVGDTFVVIPYPQLCIK